MFFKWRCLVCAELLPKLCGERRPDATVETSADRLPALRGFLQRSLCSGASAAEEEAVRRVRWGDRTNPRFHGKLSWSELAECSVVVLAAAENIFYTSEIHINMQGLLNYTTDRGEKEVTLLRAFFNCMLHSGEKHSGGIIQSFERLVVEICRVSTTWRRSARSSRPPAGTVEGSTRGCVRIHCIAGIFPSIHSFIRGRL